MTCQNTELCGLFQHQARWLMRRMDEAKMQRFHFYEETITQNILLYLANKTGHELCITPHSRTRESETGADWLFCFSERQNSGSQNNVSVLVQAKRLYTSNNYEALGSSDQQIDNLEKTALRLGAMPLYVLFNHNLIPQWQRGFACPQCRKPESSHRLWGCAIAPIFAVRRAGNGPAPCDINPMYPWHVLFNPRDHLGSTEDIASLPNAVGQALLEIHRAYWRSYEGRRDENPYRGACKAEKDLPLWVSQLQEGDYHSLDSLMIEHNLGSVVHIEAKLSEE